jgi:hypothetical protein
MWKDVTNDFARRWQAKKEEAHRQRSLRPARHVTLISRLSSFPIHQHSVSKGYGQRSSPELSAVVIAHRHGEHPNWFLEFCVTRAASRTLRLTLSRKVICLTQFSQ